MSELLLTIRDLHKSFGRHEILRGINLTVAPAMLIGIVGENGSGKSTLLRILAGELRPNRGDVFLRGAMGYCPQAVNLNNELTVNQHLEYFRAAYNINSLCRADELIKQLSYQQYRKELVGKLSGGTRQKLNLTLALMHNPSVLLLDEPYQGFDWETYLHFWKVVEDLRERRCAVLIISHLIFDEKRFDRVYHLSDGMLHETTQASITEDQV